MCIRDRTNDQFFGRPEVDGITTALATTGLTDGITPVVADNFPAVSPTSKQNLPEVKVLGVEDDYAAQTEPLKTASGELLAVEDLSDADAYLSTKAAKKLDVKTGDKVQLFSVTGPKLFNVAGVYDSGGNSGDFTPAMVVPIMTAQELTGVPDMYNMVLISNQGGMFD